VVPKDDSLLRKVFGWLITFHIVCFAWIFFRADSFPLAETMLKQMFAGLPQIPVFEILEGYKTIVGLLVLAFALHFIPQSWVQLFMDFFAKWPLVLQALYVSATIWIVIQVAQAGVQPFIYFQF